MAVAAFVFMQICLSYDTGMHLLKWSKQFVVYSSLLLITTVFLVRTIRHRTVFAVRNVVFVCAVVAIALLTRLLNADSSVSSFILVSSVISAFLITSMFTFHEYMEGYQRAMVLLSLYGMLAVFVLQPLVMNGTITMFPIIQHEWGGVQMPYIDMGLAFSIGWFGLQRAFGVFREPGVFQFFLLVSLAFELFWSNREPNKIFVAVFVCAILSTFSTAGLAALCILLLGYFTKRHHGAAQIRALALGSLGLIVAGAIVLQVPSLSHAFGLAVSKLLQGTGNNSGMVRYYSILYLLEASFRDPLFGGGIDSTFLYIFKYLSNFAVNDLTGTTVVLIAAFGWPVGIWCNINYYRFCSYGNRRTGMLLGIIVWLALLVSVNAQNLIYNNIFWVFMLSPYMKSTTNVESQKKVDVWGSGE